MRVNILFILYNCIEFCRMTANAKNNRVSTQDEQYGFCWKVYTGWDYLIGNPETSKNKTAEIVTNFRVKYSVEIVENKSVIILILLR